MLSIFSLSQKENYKCQICFKTFISILRLLHTNHMKINWHRTKSLPEVNNACWFFFVSSSSCKHDLIHFSWQCIIQVVKKQHMCGMRSWSRFAEWYTRTLMWLTAFWKSYANQIQHHLQQQQQNLSTKNVKDCVKEELAVFFKTKLMTVCLTSLGTTFRRKSKFELHTLWRSSLQLFATQQ